MAGTRVFILMTVLLTLLGVVAAGCNPEAGGVNDEVLLQDPNYIMGSGLYKRHCAGCHGQDGEGQTSLGPAINSPEWHDGITDEEIRAAILESRRIAGTSMDSFREILTDDEITAVIVYVRTLEQ